MVEMHKKLRLNYRSKGELFDNYTKNLQFADALPTKNEKNVSERAQIDGTDPIKQTFVYY